MTSYYSARPTRPRLRTSTAKQYKEDQNAFFDPKEGAMKKAILAAEQQY